MIIKFLVYKNIEFVSETDLFFILNSKNYRIDKIEMAFMNGNMIGLSALNLKIMIGRLK